VINRKVMRATILIIIAGCVAFATYASVMVWID